MELMVLGLFCAGLVVCVLFDLAILYALGFGLVLFLLHGRWKGFGWRTLFATAWKGAMTVRNILIAFLLIGMLTALWRDAGTIPVLVCYASGLIRPEIFLVMTFLLNCLVSVLTGTSFGTAATMGVICATMGAAMGVEPCFTGGAVLAGAYFGDRCSPVSTSALLVAELTQTDIFQNIRRMIRTAAVPFLLSCAIYVVLGLLTAGEGEVPRLEDIFARELQLDWVALLPAVVILALSLLRVGVKWAMAASILTALPISLFVQGTPVSRLPQLLVLGYQAQDSQVAAMLDGGGIVSMVRVGAIVCLAASFSGIFQKTGLLDGVQDRIRALAERAGTYTASLVTGIVTSVVACNQSLAILLTAQLCRQVEPDREKLALDMEDGVVVIAALVPWSIAGGVPLATVGAPTVSLLFAVFLYLLPLWRLVRRK